MYMYQQKSTITNLLGKQHFNNNNEYIGGKNINRYIQQGMKSNCRCTQNKGGASSSRQLSSSSDESYRGIVIFRDLIAAVSASFWEKMLPSLQRKFQRCWMHACYDALEVTKDIYLLATCSRIQLVKTSYFTLPSLTDITPAIRPIKCFVQTKFIFVSKHCFYL